MQNRILTLASDSLDMLSQLAEFHAADIERLARALADALLQDQRLFCCGNGASGGNLESFASKLGNRYDRERPALPVILLGDAALCARYRHALDRRGLTSETFDGEAAAIAGLLALHRMGENAR